MRLSAGCGEEGGCRGVCDGAGAEGVHCAERGGELGMAGI
jgi:hypothetical protein